MKGELLGLTLIAVAISAVVASRLDRIYTQVIEKRLVDHALHLDMGDVMDSTTMSAVLRTSESLRSLRPDLATPQTGTGLPAVVAPREMDPVLERLAELRSGDAARVRAALEKMQRPDRVLTVAVVRLLAWDEVASQARVVLEKYGDTVIGTMVDHLVDQDQDFAVRRRIPRILAKVQTERAFQGLLEGLKDTRFEVRYQCARALDYLNQKNPDFKASRKFIYEVVDRELSYARPVIEGRRLLDSVDADPSYAYLDEELKERADKNAEHIFSLLALILPREPLQVAFRAFHSSDRYVQGLALEYLDSVLPESTRDKVRVLVREGQAAKGPARAADTIVAEMLLSGQFKTPATHRAAGAGGGDPSPAPPQSDD